MQLDTITMDKTEARRAFIEYRRAVRERHSNEDAQIMNCYRVLSKGQQLIRLSQSIKLGGTTTVTIPRPRFGTPATLVVPCVAVCRADATMVWTRGIDFNGRCEVTTRPPQDLHWNNQKDRLTLSGFDGVEGASMWSTVRAMVPSVPPPFRPAHHLRNYHILFEAEWASDPQPPVDPALLKHVGGDVYAVLAVWDLSDVERAVLAGRTK